MNPRNRTLVCVVGQLRAGGVTWDAFRRHVLDELGADLAVCDHGDYPPGRTTAFWEHASYTFAGPQHADYAPAFDAAASAAVSVGESVPDWRRVAAIPGNWFGGIRSLPPREGAGAVSVYKRWYFLQMLKEHGCLERYDRFVVTRSDFLWLSPHPPLDLLRVDRLWIPEGEDWGGINDRHAVLDRSSLVAYLDGLTPIVTDPDSLLTAARGGSWSAERYLHWRLDTRGLLAEVRRFPCVMFLVRESGGPTSWSRGTWDSRSHFFVKMPTERQTAETHAPLFPNREAWRSRLGNQPVDTHVRIQARLCAVRGGWSLLQCFVRNREPLPRRQTIDTGIVVTLCGDALVLSSKGSRHRLSPEETRVPWRRCPPGVEGCCVRYDGVFYVELGDALLSSTSRGACRFHALPGGKSNALVYRLVRLAMRVLRLSLFHLDPID